MSAVHLTIDGAIAELRLDNPARLNALTVPMLDALAAHCETVEHSAEIRAVILTGTGEKAFCTGADIAAWGPMAPFDFARDWVRRGHRIFDRLAQLGKPTIAALNGHAFGGGLELAACCDIRVMTPAAMLALPEAGVGIVPGWSGTQRLVKRFGAQAVRRMLLGGEVLTAEEAATLGIVDQVVETGTAVEAARAYAARIAARGPAATEISKLMISVANGEDTGAAGEALGSILVAKTGDLKEGVAAFKEKRPAEFKGEW